MGRRQGPLLLLICAVAVAASSCKRKPEAALVVGVDAQPAIASRMGKVHYSAKVGEKVLVEKDIVPKLGASPFPFEIPLEGAPGAQADVVVEVFSAGLNNTIAPTPMLVRRLRAPFVRGPAKLVRLRLEGVCATNTPGFRGPACPAPQSCSNGRCIDPALLPEDLEEDYAKDWAQNRPDACRPLRPGEPEVSVGTGQTDYGPLKEGDTLQPEKGPQGGHHLWIAARQKNLKQTGTIIAITAEQPGTGLKVPPTSFVFSFDPTSDGACKLYGLRFQIDNSSVPVARFLGQPLDVKVSLRDPDGRVAESKVRINVAATTIGDDESQKK